MRGMKAFRAQPAPQNFADGGSGLQQRRRAAGVDGYKDGGMVRGPGTGTSDEVPDKVPEGTYIMPADSTQAMGAPKLQGLGAKNIPVNLSNGEFKLPPEQVHAVGVQALDQMKNATHTPASSQARGMKPGLFFASGGVVEDEQKRQAAQRPNFFPGNSPDAGANVYAGAGPANGLGSSGKFASGAESVIGAQPPKPPMAAPVQPVAAQNTDAQRQALVDQIPRDTGPRLAVQPVAVPSQPAAQMAAPAMAGAGPANGLGSSGKFASGAESVIGAQPPKPPMAAPVQPVAAQNTGAQRQALVGVGFGNGGEQQAAGAPNDSRWIDSLVSQIPGNGGAPAPAANGSQGSWRDTELGRNVNNAMMALPGIGGMARVANTGGAISTGLNAVLTGINAASRMAALGAGVTERGFAPAAPSTQAAPNPYASVTPERGRGMAEINAKAQSPMAVMPAAEQQPIGGITRIDRPGHSPLFTDNKDPDMARFLARPAGGPTKEVSDIMQRMSDKSQNEAFGRFQREANSAQYSREVQQAQAINAAGGENARNVQNRMDQEKNLRKLDIKASSAGSLIERMTAQKAYNAALAQDAGFRAGADAGSVARTQNEGATARERVQQAGATERVQMQEDGQNSRADQTQGLAQQKLGMEQEAQGFSSRAAAQQEQLRNVLLNPNATPEQRKVAQRSLAALSGKTAADRMQTVALPDTVDNGQVVRGGQALVRTLEDGSVEQVPIGAQVGAVQGGYRFKGGDPSKPASWEKV